VVQFSGSIIIGLARMGIVASEARETLIAMANDKDAEVREAVMFSLPRISKKMDYKAVVPVLIKGLRDSNLPVREMAVTSLGELGPPAKEAVPPLIALAGDKNPLLRMTLIRSIARIGVDAVPDLIEATKDKSPITRSTVVNALGNIGPDAKAAVPALITTLQDEQFYVREAATIALGNIGPDAKAALPALEKLLGDKEGRISLMAQQAIRKIEGKEPLKLKLQDLLK
jgi:HEAT repeat protein